MLDELYNQEAFQLGSRVFYLGPVIFSVISALLSVWLYRVLSGKFFRVIYARNFIEPEQIKKLKRIVGFLLLLIVILSVIYLNNLNIRFFGNPDSPLKVALIVQAFFIIQFARFLDWAINNVFIHKYYTQRDISKPVVTDPPHPEIQATKVVQYLVYVFAVILILKTFDLDYMLTSFEVNKKTVPFRLSNILNAVSVILIGRLLVWFVTQFFMYSYYKTKKVDVGVQFAFNQLISYVIYVLVSVLAIQQLGINMTLIWGGAAALLVGIGLGLQQTFNDFFSGLVLLFERSVKIGDILHIDNFVGKVRSIGLRSSVIETIGKISLTVPNSILVNQNIHNWSNLSNYVRFDVSVGVAYGSDTALVKQLLLEASQKSPYILKAPAPFVRFEDFGDSGLLFKVFFFSRNFIIFEDIRSDLRFEIDRLFRENNVSIPFPQRDVWMRGDSKS